MTQRGRQLLIFGAAVCSTAVVVWSVLIFSAIWLRTQAAQQLVKNAKPLQEVHVTNIAQHPATQMIREYTVHGYGNDIAAQIDRLCELQRPGFKSVWQHLMNRSAGTIVTQSQHIASFELRNTGQLVTYIQSANDPSNARVQPVVIDPPQLTMVSGQLTDFYIHVGDMDVPYLVTDARGKKLLVLQRRIDTAASRQDSPAFVDSAHSDPTEPAELIIVDDSGQIVDRVLPSQGRIIGKLVEPVGMADAVVIASFGGVVIENGAYRTMVVGPGSVQIIEDGRWKLIRRIESPHVEGMGTAAEEPEVER